MTPEALRALIADGETLDTIREPQEDYTRSPLFQHIFIGMVTGQET